MAEINKSYEPADVEKRWYAAWQKAGAFAGRHDAAKSPYCIVIPPPNVTGVLTMGHVLNNSLQDILIRRARLECRRATTLHALRFDRNVRAFPRARRHIQRAGGWNGVCFSSEGHE